jgi:hypothetical protein
MYKLEFTLKQHTPIIHFQHDQDGATLRATEVKPKLDRFLIEKLKLTEIKTIEGKEKEVPKTEFESYFINGGKQHLALDYKLKIVSTGLITKYFVNSNPKSKKHDDNRTNLIFEEFEAEYLNETQYFGNNKNLEEKFGNYSIKDKEEVKLGLLAEGIKLTIITKNEKLNEILNKDNKKFINAFFCTHTFGTRNSKGFGVFLPLNLNKSEFLNYAKLDTSILGFLSKEDGSSWENKIKKIASEYAIIKRGQSAITVNGQKYIKSKLWDYICKNQSLKWEKRKIKLDLKSNNPTQFEKLKFEKPTHKIEDCNNGVENYKYIRALLGLAEHYEFVNSDNTRFKVKISDSTRSDFKIDRFQSPISYFILDSNIFIIVRGINQLLTTYSENGIYKTRAFNFKSGNDIDFNLEVPNNFDILDFVKTHSGYKLEN